MTAPHQLLIQDLAVQRIFAPGRAQINDSQGRRQPGFRDLGMTLYFMDPLKNQFQMVGNAVPPPVSFEIAEIIKRNWGKY